MPFFFFFFLISNICLYTVHIFGPSDKSSFLRSGDDLVYFYIIQNSDNCWTEHCIYAFRYSRKCTTKRQNLIQIVPKPAKTIFFEFQIFFPFSLKLSKNTWDPREVIVWKFEGPTSNGLVARVLYLYIHTKLVKLVDRYLNLNCITKSFISANMKIWLRPQAVYKITITCD